MDRYGLVKYPEEEGGGCIEPLEDGGYILFSDYENKINSIKDIIEKALKIELEKVNHNE